MPISSEVIQKIEHSLLPRLSSSIRLFFSMSQLEKWEGSIENMNSLVEVIPSLTEAEIEQIEKGFRFEQGEIVLERNKKEDLNLITTLLFAAIDLRQNFWQIHRVIADGFTLLDEKFCIELLKNLPNIQDISFSHCTQLSDQFMQELSTIDAKKWRSIHLSKTNFSGKELVAFFSKTEELLSLSLSQNQKNIKTHEIERLKNAMPRLKEVYFDEILGVEGLAFVHFFQNHPFLETISLKNCSQFRSALLPFLQKDTFQIRQIFLSQKKETKKIFYSYSLVQEFINSHPNLEVLDLAGIQFPVNDIIYAYEKIEKKRTVAVSVHIQKEDVLFPVQYPEEKKKEKIQEIREAFEEKNVLLLF